MAKPSQQTSNLIIISLVAIVAIIALSRMTSVIFGTTDDTNNLGATTAGRSNQEFTPFALSNEHTPEAATKNLLRAAENYKHGHNQEQLREIAQERHTLLAEKIKTDPATVLALALDASTIQGMPAEIQEFLEQRVHETGALEVTHTDTPDEHGDLSISEFFYDLHTPEGKTLNLRFVDTPAVTPGSTLELEGVQIGETIALTGSDLITIESGDMEALVAEGAQSRSAVIILFNFKNKQSTPYTQTQARDLLFGQVRQFYEENSHGQVTLVGKNNPAGDVYGYFTIPYDYIDSSSCINTQKWATAARAALKATGVNPTSYHHIIYSFPGNCGWYGSAEVGPSWNVSDPLDAWIAGNHFDLSVVGHEMGHHMGSQHANGYDCFQGSTRVSVSAACTRLEYKDPFDIMGDVITHGPSHFNNYEKGNTIYPRVQKVLTVTTSGTYVLAATEKTTSDVQTIRVVHKIGPDIQGTIYTAFLYLEYRRPFGFDNFDPTDPVVNGVTIRIAPDFDKRYIERMGANGQAVMGSGLLDMTPGTNSFLDAPLLVGKTFKDTVSGTNITTLSTNATHAIVKIQLVPPPCVRAAPTATLSPTGQWADAGQALTYQLKITNNDGVGCTASTATVTSQLPAGWTQIGSSTITLTPGASQTIPVTITSPASTIDGSYPVKETVQTVSGTVSATAAYNVKPAVQTCTRSVPTATISPTSQTGTAGQALTYQLFIKNNDNSACTASSFSVVSSLPSGWTQTGGGTVTLAPGASQTVAVSVKSAATASPASYTITEQVQSSASGTKAVSATYTVSTPTCTRGTPTATLTPSTQSGNAGQALTYQLFIKNNDNSACSASTLTITPVLPSGWSQTGSSSVTLSPGASQTITLSVKSSGTAASGSYAVKEQVGSVSGTVTPSATYSVSAINDVTPPQLQITSPTNGETAIKNGITITASASDASGVQSIVISVDGVVAKTCTAATSCTIRYNVRNIAVGAHNASVRATDTRGNVANAQVTFYR